MQFARLVICSIIMANLLEHCPVLREMLETHRANAVCASCHTKMDPLGFGLENLKAIAAWRETAVDCGVCAAASERRTPRSARLIRAEEAIA